MTKEYKFGLERFTQHVPQGEPDACWLWTGVVGIHGYGVFTFNKPYRGCTTAHRYAYELANGPVEKGLVVRHSCDTPLCCNPAHLLAGTHKQNHQDMIDRGRADFQWGHKRKFAPRVGKLSDDDVRAIRLKMAPRSEGHTKPDPWIIGNEYGIGASHVYAIAQGRRKQHVPD